MTIHRGPLQSMVDFVRRMAFCGKARFRYVESGDQLLIGVSHEDGEWRVWRCTVVEEREGAEGPQQ